uniref:CNNM transmembrane domain-containing protein n=2 Tax=Corethron hystrix TaxID=216773 RepID=A0A7S1B8K4_9STRA|mmetsp:Transcript_16765/g.37692  ORF Transcript_16765/g.37692 Transcript_16765/m.37692 type:complete len:591 (+) Transcript_16765:59-1831(+)
MMQMTMAPRSCYSTRNIPYAVRRPARLAILSLLSLRLHSSLSSTGDDERKLESRVINEGEEEDVNYPFYSLMSGLCVLCAALAAGLTMGMLSLDPLTLRIKIRSGTDAERVAAKALLPLIADHHRLLVTLLLLNFIANESLPIFLDKMFSPYTAVIVSVTFVLFFGEIVPTAIFTGPDQLAIAASLAPVVRWVQYAFAPLAIPIAFVLDCWLGHGEGVVTFSRTELNSLVKIQHEESVKKDLDGSLRGGEVDMIEGALSMSTKTVSDAYVRMREVFSLEADTVLDDKMLKTVYKSGHSRIPIYQHQHDRKGDHRAVIGCLLTKQLIIVSGNDQRTIKSLPLHCPMCVHESVPLIDLMDAFVEDGHGRPDCGSQVKKCHLAFVCDRPDLATFALEQGKPIPALAGVRGIITLEDIIEELLQKEIFDEHDDKTRREYERGRKAFDQWVDYTNKKRKIKGKTPIKKRDECPLRRRTSCPVTRHNSFPSLLYGMNDEGNYTFNTDPGESIKIQLSPVKYHHSTQPITICPLKMGEITTDTEVKTEEAMGEESPLICSYGATSDGFLSDKNPLFNQFSQKIKGNVCYSSLLPDDV